MPVVLVDPVGTGDQGFATVAATDWAGARDATEHLLALGHRRIGMVTGPIDEGCHQDRLDGYRTALHRAGVPYDEHLVRFGDSLVGGGWAHGLDLLRSPSRRRRSSAARTSRPMASTRRRRARSACASPTICRWSVSTMSSCASGCRRSSPRCDSR